MINTTPASSSFRSLRRAAYLLVAIFVIGVLTTPRSLADPQITVRVGGSSTFKLPDKNSTAPEDRANRAIVEGFEHAHPEIRLESAQGLTLGGPAADSNLLLEFAGGTAPDVVYVNFRQSATYIKQGFLLPLDDYLRQDPHVLDPVGPVIQHVLRDVGHGHIYSIPYSQYVQALYYRKDLFTAAGLDPNKPPTTWDEFYDDCKKLTDQKKDHWGFQFGNTPESAGYWWINFLWQAGGEIVRRNPKTGQWEAAFNTPAGVKALLFYRKLMKDPWKGPDGETYYGVAYHSADMDTDRARGKDAMWFQYQSNIIANNSDASSVNPNLIGIAPMPAGPTGISANEINAAMWGISSQIKDPKVREAAWEFVKYMASDEADRIRTKAFVQAGLGNTINPLSLAKYGYEDYASSQSKGWLAANKTLFLNGKPEPYADNMSQIYILLGIPLGAIEANPNADPVALLNASAKDVNSKLTGYVDPRVMAHRRLIAWIAFAVVVFGGGFFFVRYTLKLGGQLLKSFGDGATGGGVAGGNAKQIQILAWVFMIPAVASILFWSYYPLSRGLVIAFQNYHIIGNAEWVGLDNFIDAFTQDSFWHGLLVSLEFTAMTLGIGFFLPIFLALALSEIPRGKLLFRTLYYLPAVTSGLIIVFLWKQFETETAQGLFNTLLANASLGHIKPIGWLTDPKWAVLSVVLPRVWAGAGPGCIIYLAALKGVDEEMYEAADLDGAGIWQKITKITLPTLKPLILINLVGATIGAFQATDTILVMTGGGPVNATETTGLQIFYNAFLYLKFGYATAIAWVMGALLVGFTLWQLRMLRDLKFSAAKS